MNKAKKPWLDSSIIHFAAGCIGYRWAVKVFRYVTENPDSVEVDTLFFSEILERYERLPESDVGKEIYDQVRKTFALNPIRSITVEDFLQSAQKSTHAVANPRLLLRLALMEKAGSDEYLATFATGIEHFDSVQRVNFMDRIS